MRMIAAAVMMALAIPCFGQQPTKPSTEHDNLKARVGVWTTTMKFNGMDFKGTITYKMELDGLWLVGDMDSEMFGQKFTGKSLDTFDAGKKKYISIWLDSMSTSPLIMEGSFDKATKTLTMTGEGMGMDGKQAKYKSVSELPDDDTENMTMYVGDAKEPVFSIVYKRKK